MNRPSRVQKLPGGLLAVFAVALAIGGFLLQPSALAQEERAEGYFTLLDEDGREVFMTAIVVAPGDVFIAEDNRAYEVASVDGDTVRVRFMEIATLDEEKEATRSTIGRALSRILAGLGGISLARKPGGRGTVVMYNTHSDESYVPSGGSSTKDWGDVYKVAAAFEGALQRNGFQVVRSTANHNPHDGGAYARSRRTLAQLLKERPIAAFDIHRDAVPPQAYRATVAGEDVTKITLVVGQQNQTKGQNVRFAKQIKSAADARTPGLIKGILWAQGNYNQDMLPRAMLIEVGAHTNRLDEAERAVGLLAGAISPILGAAGPGVGLTRGSPGRAAAWIVGLVVVAGGGFFLMNTGSRQRILTRFRSLLGQGRKRRQ